MRRPWRDGALVRVGGDVGTTGPRHGIRAAVIEVTAKQFAFEPAHRGDRRRARATEREVGR